jgi:ribosomal protein S27AE
MQDFHSLVADFEVRLIQNALDQNDGKQTHAAVFLGITYRELRYLINKYSDRLAVLSRKGNLAREKRLIAYVIYNEALKSGVLAKPDSCSVCGWVGAIQGHHPDYDKPLEVVWMCGPCHRLEHSRLKQLSRKQITDVISVVT